MTELLYPKSRGLSAFFGLTRQCCHGPLGLTGAGCLVIFYLTLYALARSHVAALNHCCGWVGFRMSTVVFGQQQPQQQPCGIVCCGSVSRSEYALFFIYLFFFPCPSRPITKSYLRSFVRLICHCGVCGGEEKEGVYMPWKTASIVLNPYC